MKITNNMWREVECNDKVVEVLSLIYSTSEYIMIKGDYEEAEDYIVENGLALWEIFFGKLTPMNNLSVLETILSEWEDTMIGNKILTNVFWKYEKN